MKKGNENLLLIVFWIIVTLILIFVALSLSKPDEIKDGEPIGNSKPVERLIVPAESSIIRHTEIFHIKARYWYNCKWEVVFTNDNFKSEETFMNTFDLSMNGYGNDVVHQQEIFKDEREAVLFARKFTTYQQCVNYNDSVKRKYNQLLEYRKIHPCTERAKEEDQPCKDDIGKEVIIY